VSAAVPSPSRGRPCVRAALALILALAPGPAYAAPSERDLAYEQGLAAEEAGDDLRAAAAYERAYALTSPGESGPRLLFLRAGVAASLRADAGTEIGRTQLCRARELLRGYLGVTPPTAPDPLAEERVRLSEVEARLAGADCSSAGTPSTTPQPTGANPTMPQPTGANPTMPPTPGTSTQPTATQPTGTSTQTPQPTTPPTGVSTALTPIDARPAGPRTRALWIAGGASLGLGAAAFALMGAGLVIGPRLSARGEAACRDRPEACDSNSSTIRDLVAEGRRSEQFVKAGAALGGIAVLAGVTLFALAARRARGPARVAWTPRRARGSARVAWTPRLAPGWLGLGVSGRF
jgi:hypothetical protein